MIEQAAADVQALFGGTVDDFEFAGLVDRVVAGRPSRSENSNAAAQGLSRVQPPGGVEGGPSRRCE